MLRFAVLAVLFSAICAIPIDDSRSSDVNVFTGESIEEYLAKNPGVEVLAELHESEIERHGKNVTSEFIWGDRAPRDRIIEQLTIDKEWEKPDFFTIRLIYPLKGRPGATINRVHITVTREDCEVKAYWIHGGIGQKDATLYIEIKRTQFVKFDGKIYGQE